jgi:Core-2/I-Branching enzyme
VYCVTLYHLYPIYRFFFFFLFPPILQDRLYQIVPGHASSLQFSKIQLRQRGIYVLIFSISLLPFVFDVMAPSPSSALSLAEKFLFPLILISAISIFLFLSTFSYSTSSILYSHSSSPPFLRGPPHPPSFAYLLSGHHSDSARLIRLLLTLYHPRNRYLLYLSADASEKERVRLVEAVKRVLPASMAFGNVDVVGRPSAGTPMGSSGLAGTLGAAAAMLRLDREWDWFITLSADDYPLLTQDGML